jgi:hypothetical protein
VFLALILAATTPLTPAQEQVLAAHEYYCSTPHTAATFRSSAQAIYALCVAPAQDAENPNLYDWMRSYEQNEADTTGTKLMRLCDDERRTNCWDHGEEIIR